MTRPLALAAVLLVAACTPGEAEQAAQAGEPISCALAGASQFAAQCRVERNGATIVVRHPDGGFRRLEVSADGQNLLAADGAQQSQSARKGDHFEVILGDDRYVIPVQADAAPR